MTGPAWTQPAVDYFRAHAIDPAVAAECGVAEKDGALVFTVTRPDGSTFERRRPLNGPAKVIQPAGEPLTLWWPQGRPDSTDAVLVGEGESDELAALSALRCTPVGCYRDLKVAAIPGTGFPVARLADELAAVGARQVALALDADEAGRSYTERARAALAAAGIEAVSVQVPDGQDLSDVLAEQETWVQRGNWVASAIADALPEVPAAGLPEDAERAQLQAIADGADEPLQTGADEPSVANGRVQSTLTDFTDIIARPIEWLWRHRVALGKITALAGAPKIGKGLFYSDLIARVTRGELDGDVAGPRNAIVVTTEDEPGDTLKPRLMAAGADLSRVSFFQMGTKDYPVPFRVPQDSDELSRRVAEKQAALVVVDPLMEFIDGKVDSHKSHPVRQAIATLNQLVREHHCAIVVIFHLNKGASTDPLLRHEGSAAFTQVVRGGLMLGRDPEDPDGDTGNQRVLAVSATNLAPMVRSLTYRIETHIVDGDTGTPIETARMVAIGESDANSHDLLRGRDDEERLERDDAADFLKAELADGPRPAKEMKTAARDAGITDITLKRAKAQLAVETNRVGGTGSAGHWEWSLLRGSPPPDPLSETLGEPLSKNPAAIGENGGSHPLRGSRHDGEPLSVNSGSEVVWDFTANGHEEEAAKVAYTERWHARAEREGWL